MLTLILFAQSTAIGQEYHAYRSTAVPVIDGIANEPCWEAATWAPIDQLWNGKLPIPENCSVRYKACWNGAKIFVLMEVIDDVLVNWNPTDPLKNYPSNDCPEIFIDEDASGGEHTRSYNAFAYHISTLYDVVDMDIDGAAKLFNNHIQAKRSKTGNTYLWEMAITVYTDKFDYNLTTNEVSNLQAGKTLGFSAAYNDSDARFETREAMLGSAKIDPWRCSNLGYSDAGTNCSWQTASVFGTMVLKDLPLAFDRVSAITALKLTKTNEGIRINGMKGNNPINVKIYNLNGTLLKEFENLSSHIIPIQSLEISQIHFITIENDGVISKHKVQW